MNNILARLYLRIHELKSHEHGQDMVEYGMLVSLIALLLIASINQLAVAVNTAFAAISTSLA
jgi:Flp pilus assembly pilin Flp